MRLIPRIPRNDRLDLIIFGALFVLGVIASVFLTPYGELRPFLAVAAFVSSATFVTIYAFRRWWSTPAGRAVMFAMSAMTLLSGHVTVAIFWPGYGYPGYITVGEIIYLAVALASAYKVRALTRYDRKDKTAYSRDASYGQPNS